jgi:hypothetical protein
MPSAMVVAAGWNVQRPTTPAPATWAVGARLRHFRSLSSPQLPPSRTFACWEARSVCEIMATSFKRSFPPEITYMILSMLQGEPRRKDYPALCASMLVCKEWKVRVDG